jgi:hypothetical protein
MNTLPTTQQEDAAYRIKIAAYKDEELKYTLATLEATIHERQGLGKDAFVFIDKAVMCREELAMREERKGGAPARKRTVEHALSRHGMKILWHGLDDTKGKAVLTGRPGVTYIEGAEVAELVNGSCEWLAVYEYGSSFDVERKVTTAWACFTMQG